MSVLKKLRKGVVSGSFAFILLGLMLAGGGIFLALLPDLSPTNLDEISFEDLKEERFVALKKYVLLYEYAYLDEEDITYSFFVIGSVNTQDEQILLTLRVTEEEANRLIEYADANPEEYWFENQFYYGTLNKVSKDLKALYDEALVEMEPGPDDLVSYLYVDGLPGVYIPDDSSNQIGGVVLIILGLFIGIVGVLMLLGMGQRSVMKVASKLDLRGSGKHYFEDFELQAQEYKGVYLSNEAILFNQGTIAQLIPLNDLIWAYTRVLETKIYFLIKISTYYTIILRTSNKRQYQLTFKKQAHAEEMLTALMTKCPNLVVTEFSSQLQKEFKKNPLDFKETVKNLGVNTFNK